MTRFLQFVKGLSGFGFLFLVAFNGYLSWRAYSVVSSPYEVVHTNVVEIAYYPTNSVSNFASPSPVSVSKVTSLDHSSPSLPVPQKVADYDYQYFVIGRRIGACMFGRYYYEGSPCSYGRISQIYPDRILLSNGDWICNKVALRDGLEIPKNDK